VAFAVTHKGRDYIIDEYILKAIPGPRDEVSEFAPKMISMKIHPDKIREVIGTGGKVIQKIVADTGAKIDIEDDGSVFISAVNRDSALAAKKIIDGICFEPEVGEIYEGKVTRILPIGAFVEIAPGKEGLVHISKLDTKRTEKVEDVCKEGDTMIVKVMEIDPKTGKYKLSRRVLLEKPEGYVERERRPRPERPERPQRGDRPQRGERGERRPRPNSGNNEEVQQ
jgi:polyribonucleotide nucleotidyltransferase